MEHKKIIVSSVGIGALNRVSVFRGCVEWGSKPFDAIDGVRGKIFDGVSR